MIDDSVSLELTIGEVIRIYRKRKGITQQQLAEFIGVSVSTVINYEKGKSIPDLNAINRIDIVLGIKKAIAFREFIEETCVEMYFAETMDFCDTDGNTADVEIPADIFRLYCCEKRRFACFELAEKMYLICFDTELENEDLVLAGISGNEFFIDKKSNLSINSHYKVTAKVLCEVLGFRKFCKKMNNQRDALI